MLLYWSLNQSRLIFPKIQIIFFFFWTRSLKISIQITQFCASYRLLNAQSLCIEIQSHSINVYLVVCKFWFRTIRRVGQYFIREINTFYIRKWRKFFRCIFVLWTVIPVPNIYDSKAHVRFSDIYKFIYIFFSFFYCDHNLFKKKNRTTCSIKNQ